MFDSLYSPNARHFNFPLVFFLYFAFLPRNVYKLYFSMYFICSMCGVWARIKIISSLSLAINIKPSICRPMGTLILYIQLSDNAIIDSHCIPSGS